MTNLRSISWFAGAALAACSHAPQPFESADGAGLSPTPPEEAGARAGNDQVVIGTIVLADAKLVVLATGHGPRYQVYDAAGVLESDNIDEHELAVRHPTIYEIFRAAYARRPHQPYLDASR